MFARRPEGSPIVNRKVQLFTPEVLENIPKWVWQGLSKEQIATRIGCTLGSLKTMCSIHKISLNRGQPMPGTVNVDRLMMLETTVSGPCFDILRYRARVLGTSAEELTTQLLERICADDLFNAILDGEGV